MFSTFQSGHYFPWHRTSGIKWHHSDGCWQNAATSDAHFFVTRNLTLTHRDGCTGKWKRKIFVFYFFILVLSIQIKLLFDFLFVNVDSLVINVKSNYWSDLVRQLILLDWLWFGFRLVVRFQQTIFDLMKNQSVKSTCHPCLIWIT